MRYDAAQEADMNPLLLLLSLAATQPDPALLAGLEYRQLHLARGGRSTAVTGVAADPFTFYFGGIGGDAIIAGSLAPSPGIRERMRDLLPRLDAALARFEALAKTAQLGQGTLR
jgi:hypothetical protein